MNLVTLQDAVSWHDALPLDAFEVERAMPGDAYARRLRTAGMLRVSNADESRLAALTATKLAAEHRFALFVDRAMFATLEPSQQRGLTELCTRIAIG